MHVDGAAVAEIVEAPDLVEQLVAGIDAVRRGGEVIEKLHLLGRRVDLLAVDDELVGIEIDDELVIGELLALLGDLLARAAEHRVHAREQLLDLKGLDDIVIRAHLEAGDLVLGLALGREHDDRDLAVFADGLADLPAIHDGQHDIEHDEIGVLGLRQMQARSPVVRDEHLEAVLLQIQPQELGNIDIVLNDDDFLTHM